jgi:hypothetical protein
VGSRELRAVRDPRARQPDREELVESLARVAASETLRRNQEEHMRTYKIAGLLRRFLCRHRRTLERRVAGSRRRASLAVRES